MPLWHNLNIRQKTLIKWLYCFIDWTQNISEKKIFWLSQLLSLCSIKIILYNFVAHQGMQKNVQTTKFIKKQIFNVYDRNVYKFQML